jgi:hypothetical protein
VLAGKDTTGQQNAYAGISGLPIAGDVAALLTGNPTVAATFGTPGFSTFAQGSMGGAFPADGLGLHSYTSEIDLVLDSTKFATPGTLFIGFLDDLEFGGFDTLQFLLAYEGSIVIDETFSSAAQASAFFDDKVRTIGNFAAGPQLDISIDFIFSGDSPGEGYGFDFLLGANAALVPPPETPVPEPATLLIFAGGLAALLVSPRTATRLRRRAA